MEGILPPSQLNLRANDLASEWRRWKRAFSDYLLAINLVDGAAAVEKRKLALFRHIGGEDVRELYTQMEFMEADADGVQQEIAEGTEGRKLSDVLAKFHEYCNPRSGVVVSRFEFHRCSQQGESIDVYLMKLRRLAEGCDFGTQRDSLIRDKLLFGLDDTSLRDKLMREADRVLTLEYVIKAVRVNEVSKATANIKLDNHSEVNYVRSGPKFESSRASSIEVSKNKCSKCGTIHGPQNCPALGTKCNKCSFRNHWANMCKTKRRLPVDEMQEENLSENSTAEVYFGEISQVDNSESGSWFANLKVCTDERKNQLIRFKLDTGAALSVCGPRHCKGTIHKTTKRLFGPGHTPLHCLGVMNCNMRAGAEMITEELYIIDKQTVPLLSRKACENLKLLSVDHTRCDIGSIEIDSRLFRGLGKLDREYSITLASEAKPFAIHVPRPIAIPLRAKAEEALNKMIEDKVIISVKEPTLWVAPMVVVPKPNQEAVRICTDYTELNKYILREVHPMSTVEDSLASLGKGKVFSKIDANSGFWQIPLSTESSKLTTFLTHKGRYRYLRLPQGLNSSPEIFQAEMNRILSGLEGVIIHMDDVLVVGGDQAEHDDRLAKVLKQILEAGMTLNKSKCQFGVPQVQFLGHTIDKDGIHAGPRLQGIADFPTPKKVTDVRSFLGLVNQFAKFSSKLAEVSKPLRDLLHNEVEWYWGDSQVESFQKVKDLFYEPPVLAVYSPQRTTIITTDASNYGLGATLSQVQDDGTRRLVAAASRSLSETEQRYAAIEKESLGICWAMEKFSRYVLGMKQVVIETDHKPLITLFGNKFLDRLPARIQGFKLRLQRFNYVIRHISGKANTSADALSRNTSAEPEPLDFERIDEIENYSNEVVHFNGLDKRLELMREGQYNDEVLTKVISYVKDGWPIYLSAVDTMLRPYFDRKALLTINKGLLMLGTRIVIPLAQRVEVLGDLHQGHLGITKCQSRARNCVWWPNMYKAIETMIDQCQKCREEANKVTEPLRPTATPDRPWQVLGSDLFHFKGQVYLMLIDYYSRYPEISLLGSDTSSRNVITHMKSIFSRHGVPEYVISDNGPQYSASEFSRFATDYGFTHVTSSPYYPRANGAAERAIQTVKKMLTKENDPYLAMLAYRSSPQLGSYSPAELLMGRKLRTTVITHPDNLKPTLPDHEAFQARNDAYKNQMKENHDNTKVRPLRLVERGNVVQIRDNKQEGTVQQSSDSNTRSVVIQSDNGRVVTRNRSAVVPLPDVKSNHSAFTRSGRLSKPPKYLDEYDCS